VRADHGEEEVRWVPTRDASELAARLRAAGCVYAEEEAALLLAEPRPADVLSDLVERRAAGEPLEHLLGWAEFCGMRVAVTTGVFVPRRRSAVLVGDAVPRLRGGDVVVDVCAGCGAVGAALEARVPGIELYAMDVDPAAVACARRNVVDPARVLLGDLLGPLPDRLRGRVALIVGNAPYVPTDGLGLMPAEARLHEPRHALDGGADGVALHRRIAAEAVEWLAPGGRLLLETSRVQAGATVQAFVAAGLVDPVVLRDEDVDGTAVAGRLPSEAQ
jgi:release factor glutamine methyltransferase